MNKTMLMQQQENIRNEKVYNPAESLSTVANVISPLSKSFAKSANALKKSGDQPLFVNPIGGKTTNLIVGDALSNPKRDNDKFKYYHKKSNKHYNNKRKEGNSNVR